MRILHLIILLFLPVLSALPVSAMTDEQMHNDWACLSRYAKANQILGPAAGEKRVVFFGDSITDAWPLDKYFPGKPFVNRGISGQTTPQMLLRFRQDVVALKPHVVVILAGTNDIAGNTGPETADQIAGYIQSMIELAEANHIKVVLSSVLPARDYPWRPGKNPVSKIPELNEKYKGLVKKYKLVYLDYFSHLVDQSGGMKASCTNDGVHPTDAGYRIMAPLALKAVEEAANSGKKK